MREEYEDFFAYQDERKVTITVREAAELLGLHTNTIYKYIRSEQLPALHIGRKWLIDNQTLYRIVRRQESKAFF